VWFEIWPLKKDSQKRTSNELTRPIGLKTALKLPDLFPEQLPLLVKSRYGFILENTWKKALSIMWSRLSRTLVFQRSKQRLMGN